MTTLSLDDVLMSVIELPIDRKKGNRLMIGRRVLGQKIFSSTTKPAELLSELVAGSAAFLKAKNMEEWFVDNGVRLQQLLVQAFCLWVIPVTDFADNNRPRKPRKNVNNQAAPLESPEAAAAVRKAPLPPPPPTLSVEEKMAVVRAALKVPSMRMESKTWALIIRSLQLRDASICPQFLSAVDGSLADGTASFELLTICMHDKPFRTHFPPEFLLQALLLGPLRGSTVEAFASERTPEFRAECRRLLHEAEKIAEKRELWVEKVRQLLNREPETVPALPDFLKHVCSVLQELRAEPPEDDRVHKGWAYAALKRAGKRYYDERTFTYDMFHELIWSILAQRPEMKSSVLRMLCQDFRDPQEASNWTRFNPYTVSPKEIPLLPSSQAPLSLLQENVECLTLPIHLASTVMFVGHLRALQIVDAALEALRKTDKPMVGLDAEWSAYTGYSKASILQLATKTRLFIIDLQPNTPRDQDAIVDFLDRFFSDDTLLKIGFGFHEDLTQLRNAVPRCRALYAPKKLICVDQLAKNLRVLAGQSQDGDRMQTAQMDDSAEADISMEDADDSTAAARDDAESPQKVVKPKEARGLAALCVQFLGRPLDKTEQCSVWDRRPLRPSQLRYAALDAYCLLQIFERCVAWAEELGVDALDIALKHQYAPVSLPLFCGDM
uniref:3'-5' exonuclease domain-containing protein n=1 Tax=Plectus sambesii TaxID=2011161 RepID=A0A914X0Q9_9BILA